ncbi:DUF6264 family protein [Microbacterium sp.]|uniref:DUF6264 family protein n=1 Tax=Microbacterium sp. TaxID=51671 RepID=UPI0025E8DCF5|nr:DUF6264 family protein [Microbacterium sp.]
MSTPAGEEPDSRPRPQYGEYASPEQQQASIREPVRQGDPRGVAPTVPVAPRASAPVRRRTVDRVVTVALLAYGLVTVLSAVPQLWDFSGFAETWMGLAGIDGTFTNTAQGDLWGRIGAGAFAFGWVLTVVFAWRSVTARRLSWWIPVAGAAVSFIIVSVCLTVPLIGDPVVYGFFSGGAG